MSAVGSSSTVQGSPLFGALAGDRVRGPVVGDRGREQRDVDVGERERGVEHRLGGRRRDRLDAGGRRDGEVRGEQDDLRAAPARLLGERDAHPARRAVADEAGRVERLARAAGGDEHALARRGCRGASSCSTRAGDLAGLGHPAHAPLALGRLALVGPDELDAAGARASRRSRGSPGAPTCAGSSPGATSTGPRWASAASVSEVVGEPVGELRERVRGARRDDEQVGAGQVQVEVLAGRPARERGEGLGADEPLGAGRDERDHLVARA